MNIHSGIRPFKCEICEKAFARKDHLLVHTRIHTGEKPYRCEWCNLCFIQQNRLDQHMKHKHKSLIEPLSRKFHTDDLTSSEGNRYNLENNNNESLPEDLSSTTEGSSSRDVKADYKSTISDRTNEKSYESSIDHNCNITNANLTNEVQKIPYSAVKPHGYHVVDQNCIIPNVDLANAVHKIQYTSGKTHGLGEKHTGNNHSYSESSSNCTLVDDSEDTKQSLESYFEDKRDSSTKELDRSVNFASKHTVKCEVCGKLFSNKHNLGIHMNIHLGIKPYECKVCGKMFTRKGNLIVHTRIHTGEKPFRCSWCDRCFVQKNHLDKHKKKKHKNIEGKVKKHGTPVHRELTTSNKRENSDRICGNDCIPDCRSNFADKVCKEQGSDTDCVNNESTELKRGCFKSDKECDVSLSDKSSFENQFSLSQPTNVLSENNRCSDESMCISCGKTFGSQADANKHQLLMHALQRQLLSAADIILSRYQ